MNFVARLVTRSNLEWASLFVGFAIIWMVSGLFVQEPEPPALIEKKEEFFEDEPLSSDEQHARLEKIKKKYL